MDLFDIYTKVIEHYGITPQMLVTVEEMSELQKEIVKFFRKCENFKDKEEETITKNIIEEIADVENCLAQLKIIFDVSDDEIDEIKLRKMKRQLTRIKSGD